jgi:hypothetical protein
MQSVQELIFKSFEEVSSVLWEECIKRKNIEDDYWKSDGMVDNDIDNLIIDFNDSSESEDSEEEIEFNSQKIELNCNFSQIDHNYSFI